MAVTSAIPSLDYVTGSEILNQGDLRAALYSGMINDRAGLTGYLDNNPTLARELGMGNLALGQGQLGLGREQLGLDRELGMGRLGLDRELGFGQLGLGRDQLNASIADAQRQYQLDLQRFGLDVAEFNFQQRIGEATVRLEQLGLLSSLRGPADYLAHNYVLNDMAAPPGQRVDPFQLTSGLNQQYTAPPPPNIPQPPPTTMYDAQARAGGSTGAGGTGGGGGGFGGGSGTAPAIPPPSPTGLAISGNPQADAALKASPAWSGAPDPIQAEFDRISQNMQDTYGRAVAQNPNFQLFAQGGQSGGGAAIVGDDPSGRPTGNEELVVSPGPFTVMDHEDTMASGALDGSAPQPPPELGADQPLDIRQLLLEAFRMGQQSVQGPGGAPGGGLPDPMNQPPQLPPGGMPPDMSGGGVPRAAFGGNFPGWQRPDVQLDPMENPGWGQNGLGSFDWRSLVNGQSGGAQGGWPGMQDWWQQIISRLSPEIQQRMQQARDYWTQRQGQQDGQQGQQQWPFGGQRPVYNPGTSDSAVAAGTNDYYDYPAQFGQQGQQFGQQVSQQAQQLGNQAGQTGQQFGQNVAQGAQQLGQQLGQQGQQFAQGMQDWAGQLGPQIQQRVQDFTQGFGGQGFGSGWGGGNIPRMATGGSVNPPEGSFNFNVHSPQDTANAPFVQQTLGNQPSYGFNQRGQDLGPFGKQPFSYTNYASMLPSAREMLRGYIETPAFMGGLGSDWLDELERSRRAAATGVSFGPTQYGG